MTLQDSVLHVDSFTAVTLGIIVLFLGKRLNEKLRLLREFSIPESVSGGLCISFVFFALFLATGYSVDFDLSARDSLLVYFFTTIGINASFGDLKKGGKPLL
ncbi:MAG: sodium/glutamate symporter, partial [Vibrio sp.]